MHGKACCEHYTAPCWSACMCARRVTLSCNIALAVHACPSQQAAGIYACQAALRFVPTHGCRACMRAWAFDRGTVGDSI